MYTFNISSRRKEEGWTDQASIAIIALPEMLRRAKPDGESPSEASCDTLHQLTHHDGFHEPAWKSEKLVQSLRSGWRQRREALTKETAEECQMEG